MDNNNQCYMIGCNKFQRELNDYLINKVGSDNFFYKCSNVYSWFGNEIKEQNFPKGFNGFFGVNLAMIKEREFNEGKYVDRCYEVFKNFEEKDSLEFKVDEDSLRWKPFFFEYEDEDKVSTKIFLFPFKKLYDDAKVLKSNLDWFECSEFVLKKPSRLCNLFIKDC